LVGVLSSQPNRIFYYYNINHNDICINNKIFLKNKKNPKTAKPRNPSTLPESRKPFFHSTCMCGVAGKMARISELAHSILNPVKNNACSRINPYFLQMMKKGGAGCLRGKEAKGVDCEYTLPSQPNRVINLVEGLLKKLKK